MDDNKEILNIDEAAKYLKISRRTMFRLIKKEDIPHKKVLNKYRFDREILLKWVQGYFD